MNFDIVQTQIINNLVSHREKSLLFTIILFFMSIFLNQTSIIFGINISFSDLFCLLLLTLISSELKIPIKQLVFFLILSLIVLFSSSIVVPFLFSYYPDQNKILVNYLKLVVVFVYFILGFSLSKQGFIDRVLKWYSIFGLICAIVGIIWSIFQINFLSDLLFMEGRYKGLMNDPNYFSIVQITSLAYLSRTIKNEKLNIIVWFIFLLSIIVSGSKTGMVTLLIYLSIRILEYLIKSRKNIRKLTSSIFFFLFLIIVLPLVTSKLEYLFELISNFTPVFSRIGLIFTDFTSAVSDDGSARDKAWGNAVKLIELSPIFGIGVGTYSGLADFLFGKTVIAHNTYLQLAVEWGVPLTLIFYIYVIVILGKTLKIGQDNSFHGNILRDIIIILLIGSLAISLNNARMFWVFFGALVNSVYYRKT
ncbi:O-antigen ligase family protein [Calidifontibacillus erzurumensis]|uniref:O-antigen ligase family protein n=1 Tax=Calidifontibacillus erzurumensis TaxID=2741433 RepID=UPI0035B52088